MKMNQTFGDTYGGNNPQFGVYTENNLAVWQSRATAISHHWTREEADKAAAKETADRNETCVVVEYETAQ